MFVDRTRIRATGGAGGNGCCSFRREKYVPHGGPNGGDGGNGGNVCFQATARVTSLEPLRFHAHKKADRGTHGQGKDRHGRTGADTVLEVPCGTLVRNLDTGEILADLTEEHQRFLAARGGQGGKGNARFATATDRAPRFAERGEPGEDRQYILELKLIAEVGIVGLPNAGKSTLLARISAARPKVADYPFTTLSPNLGVAPLDNYRTLVVADIPGIIEGAAEGKGLGHDFLRHIERTKVLLFLIDLGDDDPVATKSTLENELDQHSPLFAQRPKVFALNKADIPQNRDRFDAVASTLGQPLLVSAVTGEGVSPLLEHLWRLVAQVRQEEADAPRMTPDREYSYEAPFSIEKTLDGFRITGKTVLRAVQMTDFDNEYAVQHLRDTLRRLGLYRALKRLGAQPGQTVTIGDLELDYYPDD